MIDGDCRRNAFEGRELTDRDHLSGCAMDIKARQRGNVLLVLRHYLHYDMICIERTIKLGHKGLSKCIVQCLLDRRDVDAKPAAVSRLISIANCRLPVCWSLATSRKPFKDRNLAS